MNSLEMRILIRAANIRVKNGEDLEEVLKGWPNLTEEEKQIIRDAINTKE